MDTLWVIVCLVQWLVLLLLSLLVFAISQEVTELHKRLDVLHKIVVMKPTTTKESKKNDEE